MSIPWKEITRHPAAPWALFAASRLALLLGYAEYVSDTRLYAIWAARAWATGGSAYVDFPFPYAPLGLLFIYVPWIGGSTFSLYRGSFRFEMLLLDIACFLLMTRIGRDRLRLSANRALAAAALYSILSLFLGHLLLDRLDLAITASFLAVLYLPPSGLRRQAGNAAAATAGILVKLVPLAWLPWTWLCAWKSGSRGGWRPAASCALLTLAPSAVVLAAWQWWTSGKLATRLGAHAARGIQIESIWAAPLWIAYLLGDAAKPALEMVLHAHEFAASQIPAGYAEMARLLPPVALLVFPALLAWRLRATGLVDWTAARSYRFYFGSGLAVMLLAVATQRVLSPQYFIWLLAPLCLGLAAGGRLLEVLAVASLYVLTWGEFDRGYSHLLSGNVTFVSVLLARNAVLAGLAVWSAAHVLMRLPLPEPVGTPEASGSPGASPGVTSS